MKALFIISTFLFCFNSLAQQELFLKPELGKTYTAQQKTDMLISIDYAGKKMSTPGTNEIYWTMYVREIGPTGNVTIDLTVKRVVMEVKHSTTNVIDYYDSDLPQDTKEYQKTDAKIRPSINQKRTALFSNKGVILEKDSAVNNTLFECILELPKEKITNGLTWTEEKETEVAELKTTLKTIYTVSEIKDSTIVVDASSTSKMFKEPMSTKFTIDKLTGLIVSSTSSGNAVLAFLNMQLKTDVTITNLR